MANSAIDKELSSLLERARKVRLSKAQLEEHRIALAAANGHLSDERITLDTMKATRTVMNTMSKARKRA